MLYLATLEILTNQCTKREVDICYRNGYVNAYCAVFIDDCAPAAVCSMKRLLSINIHSVILGALGKALLDEIETLRRTRDVIALSLQTTIYTCLCLGINVISENKRQCIEFAPIIICILEA